MPRLPLIALSAVVFALVGLSAPLALAQPCGVVATTPPAGSLAINSAKTKAIVVTFNQAMLPGRWSFVKNPKLGAFPKLAGKPKFTDERTCVLPVELQPGVTYAVGINTEGYGNFRAQAAPSTPCGAHQIIFTTGR